MPAKTEGGFAPKKDEQKVRKSNEFVEQRSAGGTAGHIEPDSITLNCPGMKWGLHRVRE